MYTYTQTTVIAVLDTMMEQLEDEPDQYIVYYHILNGDQDGESPGSKNFGKSCFYKIAQINDKV